MLGRFVWRPPPWWLLLGVACLVGAAVLFRRTWAAALLVFMAMLAAGALLYELRPIHPHNTALEEAADQDLQIRVIAHVVHAGLPREEQPVENTFWRHKPQPPEWKRTLDLETEQVEVDNRMVPLAGGVRLTLYAPVDAAASANLQQDVRQPTAQTGSQQETPADFIHRDFLYGDRLSFTSPLHLPETFHNPGAWDYAQYLRDQGITALGSAAAGKCTLLDGTAGPRWKRWQSRLRSVAIRSMVSLSGQPSWAPSRTKLDAGDAEILVAMILGEKSQLDRDTKFDFQRTGAYHLLVVSGMNVAIMAAFVFWVARRLRANDILATVVTVALSALYAGLTDLDAPILRALLMTGVYLATRLLFREASRLNALGAAAMAILVLQPAALFDAGFQMTFLAVLAIAGVAVPVLERTIEPYRSALRLPDTLARDPNLPPRLAQFRVEVRMVRDRLGLLVGRRFASLLTLGFLRLLYFTGALLAISSLMQLALALPISVYFHRATIVGLPANIIVVPLMGMLMPLALSATVANCIWRPLAAVLSLPIALVLHGITATVQHLGGLRFAEFRLAQPTTTVAGFCLVSLAFAILAARLRWRWAAASWLLLLCSTVLIVRGPEPRLYRGKLEVTAIDVGQGDAILLVTPDGHTLLIDAGGPVGGSHSDFDFGENVVSPYLWRRGISRLDAVALTHAHSDHMGGMETVLRNFRPRELWVGINPGIPEYRKLLLDAEAMGVRVRHFHAGDAARFGDADFRMLSPPADWLPGELPSNDDSLVMRVAAGNGSVLLEGDAERKSEQRIAAEGPRAQLLKVGHHGSTTSSLPELLAAVHPQCAVISVGRHNLFGHPRYEVLERLGEAGIRTYRTDMTGATTFLLGDGSVTTGVDRDW